MTSSNSHVSRLDRWDMLLAITIALFGLLIYTRVLAPDVLYSDSAEFQTLAYTGGATHPTGYPVYLVLARLVGFIPLNTLAWRISWFSALAAGFTLGGVYLITKVLDRARRGTARRSGAADVLYILVPEHHCRSLYSDHSLDRCDHVGAPGVAGAAI